MSKQRPHMGLGHFPKSDPMNQTGSYPNRLGGSRGRGSKTPVQPSGEVSSQKGGHGGSRSAGPDVYERGIQPMKYHERTKPGGRQTGMGMSDRSSAMPKTGHQSATAPGSLSSPGSERNSATMDAKSSVPVSIQHGGNTHFGDLSYGEKRTRTDNAELDDGAGTGRRQRDSFRGSRRM